MADRWKMNLSQQRTRPVAAMLLLGLLAGCVAGETARVEAPPPAKESATAEDAFHQAMVLARQGRFAAAAPYYRMAAENDQAEAQYVLATMYRTGRGVPQDIDEAVNWYRRAADAGYMLAQFTLGNIYMKGDGVPQDVPAALLLYRQAAAQGNPQAQYNLGVYYYTAEKDRDYPEAEGWFLLAAKQGEAPAQYALGRLYSLPHKGIRLDRVRAYAWYSLAAAKGRADAEKAMAELEPRLSIAERAAARSLARSLVVESTQ